MTPHRIQLSRRKGWRLPPNTINVARPTQYGNPHRIGWCAPGDPCHADVLLRVANDKVSDGGGQ